MVYYSTFPFSDYFSFPFEIYFLTLYRLARRVIGCVVPSQFEVILVVVEEPLELEQPRTDGGRRRRPTRG